MATKPDVLGRGVSSPRARSKPVTAALSLALVAFCAWCLTLYYWLRERLTGQNEYDD